MVEITGNTFPVKDRIRALGGKWDAGRKCWLVPDASAEAARALVGKSPASPKRGHAGGRAKVCRTCGCKINYGVYCGKCEYA